MPKIYTRTGDEKTTGIQGGIRLTKHSFRIEAIGSIDELNASLGFLISLNNKRAQRKGYTMLTKVLEKIQRDLFVIGSDISYTLIKNNTIPFPPARRRRRRGCPAS